MEIPAEGAEGVQLAHGNRHGGYTFFVKDNIVHRVHNYLGIDLFRVSSPAPVPAGNVVLRYEFEPTSEPDPAAGLGSAGRSQLYIDDELVASVEIPHTVRNLFGIVGLTCGRDGTDSVSPSDYSAPNLFTGSINSVTLDVSGDVIVDHEADLQRLMAQQ